MTQLRKGFGFDFCKKPNEVGTYEKKISSICWYSDYLSSVDIEPIQGYRSSEFDLLLGKLTLNVGGRWGCRLILTCPEMASIKKQGLSFFWKKMVINNSPVFCFLDFKTICSGADLGGGCRGWGGGRGGPPPPPPEMTCGFLIQLVFCKKKKKLCGLLVLK